MWSLSPTTLKFLRYIMMWDYLRALTSNVINAKFLTFSTSDTKIKKKKCHLHKSYNAILIIFFYSKSLSLPDCWDLINNYSNFLSLISLQWHWE